MGNNPYSCSKAAAHLDRLALLRSGEQPNPVHVQWSISATCSQNCRFCAYRMEGYTSNQLFAVVDPANGQRNNNPARFISTDKAIEILDDCRDMGVKAIQFTGGGEPTVHPDHLQIMQAAVDRGMEISLVTHGALLKPPVLQFLAESATWVRVSIDASNPASYSQIRRVSPDQYHRAVRNIGELVRCKRELQSRLTIGAGFVVTRDNWSEVADCARQAKSWGVDNIRISAVFQPEDENYFRDFYEPASALCRQAQELSTDSFEVANNFGDRVADLAQHRPDYQSCYMMQFTIFVGDDLSVYRCCNTAYNTRGFIGSLQNQRLKELWQSQAKRSDFDTFDARGCERCQFNRQNRFIASLVQLTGHENFV